MHELVLDNGRSIEFENEDGWDLVQIDGEMTGRTIVAGIEAAKCIGVEHKWRFVQDWTIWEESVGKDPEKMLARANEHLLQLAVSSRGVIGTICEWQEEELGGARCTTHGVSVDDRYDPCPVREAMAYGLKVEAGHA